MVAVRPHHWLVLLVVVSTGLLSEPVRSETDTPVMVLCPGNVPDVVPDCEDIAIALDQEIEEFSMYTVLGPSPDDMSPADLAAQDVPFVVWTSTWEWVDGLYVTLHVFESSNSIEVEKTVNIDELDSPLTADDLAIIAKNLMGTSLYAELADIEEDPALMALAMPEPKEEVVLERAAGGEGLAELPAPLTRWSPQLVLGWAMLAYPGTNNTGSPVGSDVYNGLLLGLRLPFADDFWAGFSVFLPMSLEGDFSSRIRTERTGLVPALCANTGCTSYFENTGWDFGEFTDERFALTLDVAWSPWSTERVGVWISANPGFVRSNNHLTALVTHLWDPGSFNPLGYESVAYRFMLGAGAGFQVKIVERVKLEVGMQMHWLFKLSGPKNDTLVLPSFDCGETDPASCWGDMGIEGDEERFRKVPYFAHPSFGINFWLTMVFG